MSDKGNGDYDVVIVGGGEAGLNAALMLGRVRRRVLLTDSGLYRNASAAAVHGTIYRDGADPADLRRMAREELESYPSVRLADMTIESASAVAATGGFEITQAGGQTHQARRLLLATGLADKLPAIDGLAGLWGRGLYHCLYCHGWEVRDQTVAVLGGDDIAAHLALGLARLGCEVVLAANGPLSAGDVARDGLRGARIQIREELVDRVDGEPGKYVRLTFSPDPATPPMSSGSTLECRAVFTQPGVQQRSGLAAQLGCAILDDGTVLVSELGQTSVAGVYAAGDMCRTLAMPAPAAQVVMAAAAGARAAVVIDQELLYSDCYGGRKPAPWLSGP